MGWQYQTNVLPCWYEDGLIGSIWYVPAGPACPVAAPISPLEVEQDELSEVWLLKTGILTLAHLSVLVCVRTKHVFVCFVFSEGDVNTTVFCEQTLDSVPLGPGWLICSSLSRNLRANAASESAGDSRGRKSHCSALSITHFTTHLITSTLCWFTLNQHTGLALDEFQSWKHRHSSWLFTSLNASSLAPRYRQNWVELSWSLAAAADKSTRRQSSFPPSDKPCSKDCRCT